MKKTLLFLITLSLSTTLLADSKSIEKGQKVYMKTLKQKCSISGAKFAIYHTQDEWKEYKEKGIFQKEIKILCEKAPDLNEEQESVLYDFFFEYASDSGNVPSCG